MALGDRSVTTFTVTSDREIVMTRVFDAPRALVFRAYTDPTLIPQWWGLRNLTTIVDKMDLRPGGAWRFIQHGADGKEEAFNGVFREIVPPERLVSTFEYEGTPGHVVVDTVTFEDAGGKTKVTARSVFASVEDRDEMLMAGMEQGARETWDRLAELLDGMV